MQPTEQQRPPTPPPTTPRQRRWWAIALIAGAMILAAVGGATLTYLLAGNGDTSATQPPVGAATTSAAVPAANLVECANIDRAYNAWNSGAPRTATDVAALNEVTIRMRMDDGKEFLSAVSGYTDQASKTLAVAVAEYNFELGLVNLRLVLGGGVDAEQPARVVATADRVRDKYDEFSVATCS